MYRKIKTEITDSDIKQNGIRGWVTSRLDKNDPESLLYSGDDFWENIEFNKESVKRKAEKRIEDKIEIEIEREIENEAEKEIENEISEVGDMEIEREANR